MMNDLYTVGTNALVLIILFLFFFLIYVKVRRQTMTESWDEIKNWVGKAK